MADEHKKEEADLKAQIKLLKKGLLDERKKGAQTAEENKALLDKMQKMSEMTNELVEKNNTMLEENSRLKQELEEEKEKEKDKAKGDAASPSQAQKAKGRDAAREAQLQQEATKAWEECERWKQEAESLSAKLEQTQADQELLTSQFRKNLADLCESNAKLEDSVKQKTEQCAEQANKIQLIEAQLAEANKKMAQLAEDAQEVKLLREKKDEEKIATTRAQMECERAQKQAHDFEVDIANKANYIHELNETISKHADDNLKLGLKLVDMKTMLLEYETRLRIYPAAEIRSKLKVPVNLRFAKGEDGQYFFEIATLKEKRQYKVLDIDIHIHETNNKCFIVSFEKAKKKIEVYECDAATDVYQAFQEFRRLAEDIEDKAAKARAHPQPPSPPQSQPQVPLAAQAAGKPGTKKQLSSMRT